MATSEKYELIEHTADLGIRIKGKDLKCLFENAASSLFDIIAQSKIKEIPEKRIFKIKQKAENLQELFINWLNELISLAFTKSIIFSDFEIKKITENSLEATVLALDMGNFELKKEVKAATYHDLKLSKTNRGWVAEVIFDV